MTADILYAIAGALALTALVIYILGRNDQSHSDSAQRRVGKQDNKPTNNKTN